MKQGQKPGKQPELVTRDHDPKDLPLHLPVDNIEQLLRDSGVSNEASQKVLKELQGVFMQHMSYSHVEFSGPLPHPDLLREYDEIIPGMAKDHWNEILEEGRTDRWIRKANIWIRIVGQILGGGLGACGLTLGYKLAMNGSTVGAIGAMFSGLALIVSSICGKYFISRNK